MNDTAFSLLKEARGQLAAMHDHLMELTAKLPMQYFGLVDGGLIQNAGNLIGRIDAALAEPEPDAMDVAMQIYYDCFLMGNGKFEAEKAAALIESYGRRVPMTKEEPFDELGHGLC